MSGAEFVTRPHRLMPVLMVTTHWLCGVCNELRASPLNFTRNCWATKSDRDSVDSFAYAMAAKKARR